MTHFIDLIHEKNISFNITQGTKEEIIRNLIDYGMSSGLIHSDSHEEIIQALLNREKSMTTGIGNGLAIPHCSTASVKDLVVLLGISKDGIDFDSIDQQPVHIIVLLIVPKEKFHEHIKTLALIAKTFNMKSEREKLIHSESYEQIKKAFS